MDSERTIPSANHLQVVCARRWIVDSEKSRLTRTAIETIVAEVIDGLACITHADLLAVRRGDEDVDRRINPNNCVCSHSGGDARRPGAETAANWLVRDKKLLVGRIRP